MSRIIVSLIAFTSAAFISCATVPKEAPRPFHDAKASLDRAKDQKVEKTLPNTIGAAESNFDEALSSWKEAHKRPVSSERTKELENSTTHAANVHKLTDEAINLNRTVKDWDKDAKLANGKYASTTELLGRMKTMQNRVAGNEPPRPEPATRREVTSPFAMVKSLTFQNSVAYFDTNQSTLDPYYKAAVKEVAGLLELDPNLMVTVSGYADPRGSVAYNDQLSKARANAVANALAENGVNADRMRVVAMGNRSAHYTTKMSKFQLERRVDATVTIRQPPSTSSR